MTEDEAADLVVALANIIHGRVTINVGKEEVYQMFDEMQQEILKVANG